MSHHPHFVVVPGQERSLARTFGEAHGRYTRMVNFREGLAGSSVAGALPFLFDGRTERSGVTHEKVVKVSVFSVYYLPSDPIDASFSLILLGVAVPCRYIGMNANEN